jgi:hemolysin III
MLRRKSELSEHGTYSLFEERLNAATHGTGFLLAIAGLIALLVKSSSVSVGLISLVYGLSLAFMFLSSTVYHATSNVARRAILRTIDHTAIYLLIAGTYTPFLLLAVGGNLGLYGAIVVWFIGLSGIVFKLKFGHDYPKVSIATYALMGWLALFLIYPIYQSLSGTGFTLLLAGGLAYSLGIPFYLLKSRHYSHAIWHIFVVLGAACHFFAIYLFVL